MGCAATVPFCSLQSPAALVAAAAAVVGAAAAPPAGQTHPTATAENRSHWCHACGAVIVYNDVYACYRSRIWCATCPTNAAAATPHAS